MKKKVICVFLIFAILLTSGTVATFAWLLNTGMETNIEITGKMHKSYFESGDGTSATQATYVDGVLKDDEGCAFEIANELQLYYFAWLQALGYFNIDSDGDGEIEPVYFYISHDLNMTDNPFGLSFVLPEAGTKEYPFVGNFEGNGHTVSNLKITTSTTDMTELPDLSPEQNDLEIIGFFGVIGSLNENGTVNGCDYSTGAIIPGKNYDTSALEVKNLNLNNLTVETSTDNVLVGLVGGYVNGTVENVRVSNTSTIKLASGTKALAYTDNLSDYTLFGYVEDGFDTSDIVVVKMDTPVASSSQYNYGAQGSSAGFGGSIGMDELYNRIARYQNSTTQYSIPRDVTGEFHYYNNGVEDLSKYTTTTTNAQTQTSYAYYDTTNDLRGRIMYGQTKANYLWGIRNYTRDYTITKEYHTDDDEVCWYGKSGNYYLTCNNGTIGRNQTESSKTMFFADADGWIYCYGTNGTTKYYLYASSATNGTLRASTSKQSYMFRADGAAMKLYRVSDLTPYERYIRYSGGFSINGTRNELFTQTTNFKTETETRTLTYYTPGTYLPLNVYQTTAEITSDMKALLPDENLVVDGAKINNPGYIIGGTKSMTDSYGSAVRVASNYDYSDINRALGGSNTYSGSNLQILTRTKDSNGVVFIEDDFNKGVALSNNLKNLSYISSTTKQNYTTLGLKMYKNSRNNLDTQFKANTSTLYVMRFNEFQISMDHTITAEKVLLNGEIKTDYVFPESCIDFNLAQKGYINFFGGGFRGGNCNAFFSLYHIIRDESDNITSLKHMSKIYGKSASDPYIYYYDDDRSYSIYDPDTKTYSTIGSLPSGYELYFDMAWVEGPGFTAVDNTMWYFEIPVNQGEYALGAVDGKTGAYMMYLDVGANSQIVDRATVVENFTETVNTYEFPTGATFTNDTTTELPTPVIPSMTGNIKTPGTVTVKVDSTDNKIITTSGLEGVSYIADGITVDGNTIGNSPKTTVVTQIRRITYYDFNIASNLYTITEVEARKVDSGSTTFTVTAWDATYDESTGEWTKGTQLYSNTAKPTDMEEHDPDTTNNIPGYALLDINYGKDDKQTLRFDDGAFDAISGSSNITKQKYTFSFAIKENDAKIIYTFNNLLKLNQDETDPAKLYTLTDKGYDVEIQTSKTITVTPETDDLPDGLSVTKTTPTT